MKKKNRYYDNKVINKPWGYEYVIYRVGNVLSVTFLKINPGKSTSLHCHTEKKTGFALLDGQAKIQLGLWKSEQKNYKSPSKLMIRTGLFHSIKCVSKRPLLALEFETPYKKNDLVRYKDKYGRKFKPYEKGIKYIKNIDNFIKLKKPKKNKSQLLKFNKTDVYFENHYNFKKLIAERKDTIFAVINGAVSTKNGKKVLSPGDIVKKGTLLKLSESFYIKKKLTILRIKKNA